MKKLWNLLCKKEIKEIVMYLIFGGLTTLVDLLAYLAVLHGLDVTAATATAAAWFVAVLFAYATNRRFVFGCEGNLLSFVGTRLCSGLVQVLLMAALVDGLHFEKLATKLAVGVIVTIMNYAGSKLLVFRRTAAEGRDCPAAGREAGTASGRSRVAL